MMRVLPILILLLAGCLTLAAQQTTITGNLFGHDRRPLPKANVYLFRVPSLAPVAVTEAAPDGSFLLQGYYSGFFRLKFTGANHREHSLPVIIDRPGEIRLDVRLGVAPPIIAYDSTGRPLPISPAEGMDSMAIVEYHDPAVERFTRTIIRIEERQQIAYQAMLRNDEDISKWRYDWTEEMKSLTEAVREERDPAVRHALLFSYIVLDRQSGTGLSSKMVQQALDEIPPTSHIWQLGPLALGGAMRISKIPQRYENYQWKLIRHHPDTSVRVQVLFDALQRTQYEMEPALYLRYYRELVDNYPHTTEAGYSVESLNPMVDTRTVNGQSRER
jgi:hypothetical protein